VIFKPSVAHRPVLVHLIIDHRASALLPITARWIISCIAEALLLLLVVEYPQTGETSESRGLNLNPYRHGALFYIAIVRCRYPR
jgi:hypothetical protein